MTSTSSQDLSIMSQKLGLVLCGKFRYFLLLVSSRGTLPNLRFVLFLNIFLLNHDALLRERAIKSRLTGKRHLLNFLLRLNLRSWLLAWWHFCERGLLLHLLQPKVLFEFLRSKLLFDCLLFGWLETVVYNKSWLVYVQICLRTALVALLIIKPCALFLDDLALKLYVWNRGLHSRCGSTYYSLVDLQLLLVC